MNVYRELQQHLDKMPVGFPATKSGVEIRILKHIFTPEQAKIATKLTFSYEPLETIYERVDKSKMSIKELKRILDDTVKKGGIHYIIIGDEKHYANAPLVLGMYEYQIHKLTKDFIKDMLDYNTEAFGLELFSTGVTQFRIIPVEESMTRKQPLIHYENLREIIKNIEGPITIQECICRQARDLVGEPCKKTSSREACMGFGHLTQLYIDQGWGRSVTKEEALEILRQNEKDGLVLMPGNSQKPGFICSCCGCCCGMLSNIKQMPSPVDFFITNHHAVVDPQLCTACETCIERCQLDALKIVEGVSTVDLNRCIGCGNCVITCPAEAIQLQENEKKAVPPETTDDLWAEIKEKKDRIIRAKERTEERRRKREEKKK